MAKQILGLKLPAGANIRRMSIEEVQAVWQRHETPVYPREDLSNLLEGVVAVIDVRTKADNRSMSIGKAVRTLGAKVVPKFTKDVTHVIFKEGLWRTQKMAQRRNIPLVMVTWVESCKLNGFKVPVEGFLPTLHKDRDPFDPRPKWIKTMTPEKYLEERRPRKRRRKSYKTAEVLAMCARMTEPNPNGSPSLQGGPSRPDPFQNAAFQAQPVVRPVLPKLNINTDDFEFDEADEIPPLAQRILVHQAKAAELKKMDSPPVPTNGHGRMESESFSKEDAAAEKGNEESSKDTGNSKETGNSSKEMGNDGKEMGIGTNTEASSADVEEAKPKRRPILPRACKRPASQFPE